NRCDMREQTVTLDGVEHGQSRRACDRVAAEGAAVVALAQHGAVATQADACANRQSASQALSEREHVRRDALGLVREPGTCPADAALDLVEYQQGAGCVAYLSRCLEVTGRSRNHATLPKARLEENRRALSGDSRGQSRRVAERNEASIDPERLERRPDRLLAR